MPTDKSGKFHLNTQRAHSADRMAGKGAKPMAGKMPSGDDGGEHRSIGHVTVHDHGDGTMHTEHEDGHTVEHPHVGHMLMHLANHHEPDGKHMHVMQDGMGDHTTHHVAEDGEVQGPHDHANIEALKEHMGKFLDEEGAEKGGYGDGEEEASEMHGLAGLG